MDYPSGNYIKFNSLDESEVGIKTPNPEKLTRAQPRLAVALDYADIFLRDKDHGGLIKDFLSKEDDGEFTIRVNPEANMSGVNIFDEVGIVLYDENKPIETKGKMILQSIDKEKGDLYTFKPKNDIRKILNKTGRDNPVSYLKINLNSSNNDIYFDKYNYQSQWTYPIHILKRSEIEEGIEDDDYLHEVGGYVVERHSINGEIPDFEWYERKFSNEYS